MMFDRIVNLPGVSDDWETMQKVAEEAGRHVHES